MRTIFLLLVLALFSRSAPAHDAGYQVLSLRLESTSLIVEYKVHLQDLADRLGRSTHVLSREEGLKSNFLPIQDLLNDHLKFVQNGLPLSCRLKSANLEEYPHLAVRLLCQPLRAGDAELLLRRLPTEAGKPFWIGVYDGSVLVGQTLLPAEESHLGFPTSNNSRTWGVVTQFVKEGVRHIFIGPDHVLFLIGLLLLGGTWRRLLLIVTAFTLAHSLTLTAAVMEWVVLPSRWIEATIALSIMIVGLQNLLWPHKEKRGVLAFVFGLVHGFGFASVVQNFGLPLTNKVTALFSFNVGVEIGQILIVSWALLILHPVQKRWPASRRWIVKIGSWFVVIAGTYWLLKRLFVH